MKCLLYMLCVYCCFLCLFSLLYVGGGHGNTGCACSGLPAVSPALTQVSADCRAPQRGDAPLTTWGCNQAHIRASPGSNLSLVHFTTAGLV